jgi:hypothetical protein
MGWNLLEVYNFLLFVLLTVLIMATSTTNSSSNSVHTNHVTTEVIMPSVNVDQSYIFYTVNTVFIPTGERLKIRTDFDVTRIYNSHTP